MVRQKKPTSAQNAKPKIRWLVHGLKSPIFMENPIDQRTHLGKRFTQISDALIAHLGGSDMLTEPERSLVDQAVKLSLLTDISWQRLLEHGVFDEDGALCPAFDSFLRAAREHRSILQTLGLQRRQKTVPNLSDYISEQKADC